jgi:translation elongation factor P/translation initiation factor 5A
VVSVEHADLEKHTYQFSWGDAANGRFTFMHTTTFDEVQLTKEQVPHDCLLVFINSKKIILFIFIYLF